MEFRIADTFTDSLARLTGEEQNAEKTTALKQEIDQLVCQFYGLTPEEIQFVESPAK